jgi:hypothetical protein
MSQVSECRKAVKAEFPELKFKIRLERFTDLARDNRHFLVSPEWGMFIGNQETYERVKQIADPFGVITMW